MLFPPLTDQVWWILTLTSVPQKPYYTVTKVLRIFGKPLQKCLHPWWITIATERLSTARMGQRNTGFQDTLKAMQNITG